MNKTKLDLEIESSYWKMRNSLTEMIAIGMTGIGVVIGIVLTFLFG